MTSSKQSPPMTSSKEGPTTAMPATWTTDEVMTVVAARALGRARSASSGSAASTAANLARRTTRRRRADLRVGRARHQAGHRLPLSIGESVLADTADAVVSVPEVFNYWLQPGRIDVGFLGAAQLDRFANINTTVIGGDHHPRKRLPGAGGRRRSRRRRCGDRGDATADHTRVRDGRLDFITTGSGTRRRGGDRPRRSRPAPGELMLVRVHPGVTVEEARAATRWDLRVPEHTITDAPTSGELAALRELEARALSGTCATRYGRRSAATAGRWRTSVRTTWRPRGPRARRARPGLDPARRRRRARGRERCRRGQPRTSRGWPCCSPGCRRAYRARPSTGCADPRSRRRSRLRGRRAR